MTEKSKIGYIENEQTNVPKAEKKYFLDVEANIELMDINTQLSELAIRLSQYVRKEVIK